MAEQSHVVAVPEKGSFVRATLREVRRCPARADFIELCFSSEAGPWKWCFHKPVEQVPAPSGEHTLVLVLGRYGIQAHLVVDHGIGPALSSSEAMPLILDGCRPFVSRELIERGR
ncbi:hypothetical protein [Amycolatopsis sp. GM8]|uniref:hypothetical protein n=1 Tax=Amycolatopsis sp. GM8 TaxID=2896530 RepID=UPI001F179495|nr:hypothetical protein [Amycolatopsis sp. GM8]